MARSNTQIKSLQEEFPDLTQSTLGDILSTYQNDKKKATQALRQIDEDLKKEHEQKILEAQEMFFTLPREIIEATLREAQWNLENALVPLFGKVEEFERETKRKQQENLRKQHELEKQRKTRDALAYLHQVFSSIPIEEVQNILDENDGDTQATANQLYDIVNAREEEARKKAKLEQEREEAERRLRETELTALCDKFELAREEVTAILDAYNGNVNNALGEFWKASTEKKRKAIRVQFPALSNDEIDAAIAINGGNVSATLKQLYSQKLESEKPAPKIVKVVPPSLETLGKEIEREITASQMLVRKEIEKDQEARKEAVRTLFKNQLESIIATQARQEFGPGLAPPLPKQIDAIVKKEKPAVDEEPPKQETQPQQPPPVQPAEAQEVKVADSSVSLKVQPSVVDIGQAFSVEWELKSGDATTSDWIGLYPLNVPTLNKHYKTYQYNGKGETKGALTFYAPQEYGDYELRYFSNGRYESLSSCKVKVGPQIQVEAALQGTKIAVKWNKISGNDYSRAWVGLYLKSEANNKQYITWEYANKPNTDILFDAPIKPEQYEFRFFTNSYTDVARSNTISIEGKDAVTVTVRDDLVVVKVDVVTVDPYNDSAWVGLYFVEEKDQRQWRRYRYVKVRHTEIEFKAPKTAGLYEARLFANRTYEPILRSNAFPLGEPAPK